MKGKGGGGGGYVSPRIEEYEQAVGDSVFNRLGGIGEGAGMYGGGSVGTTAGRRAESPSVYTGGMYGSGTGGRVGGTGTMVPGMPVYGDGAYAGAHASTYTGGKRGSWEASQPSSSGYDLSRAGAPLYGPKGIEFATSGYDFSPITEAIAGFRNPGRLRETYTPATYNPFRFDFGQLPEEYTRAAYQSGASDIARTGRDQLTQLREAIGVRRPGLLMRAGESVGRETGRNLANLNTQLQLERMRQNLELARAQQQAQAAENLTAAQFGAGEGYRGYQSRADLERANLDNVFRNLQALAGTGQAQIATKAGLLESERGYQDRALQMLMDMYKTATGQANEAARLDRAAEGDAMDLLGTLAQVGTTLGTTLAGI